MLGDDGIDNSERHIAVHSVITIFVEQWLGRRREPDFYAHVAPLVVLLAVVVFGCLDRHLKAICADCFVMVAGILTDDKGTPRISKEFVQNFERKCGATICKDLKGIGTGKVLCPCPECVRNAVFSLGEVLGK